MKSNRTAKRLLEVSIWAYDGAYRLSNRKREFCNEDGEQQVITEPSRRQRRAKRKVDDMRIERHFERKLKDGMTYTDAYAAAVRTVRGQHTQGERG